ncbi:HNH endonuclease-domain-containing protein [Lipomyces tetrasporus]|uniref:HNH endonuclease-domain-containing protein n=1 Tax=Lipomyces tetrasporus TaxID=54092 RepID=A0AAD7VSZ3_9ASCO|nr:HNH endonuclease-domain-containing protein [Lipomyces tetrasporus]KAJ8100164.1 HNH endonuclease-domain-containing protein [Lipomyces tetrasporus]
MAATRAIGRDVHFYIFSEPDKAIGGLRLNPSVTEKNFLSMLGILMVASGPYRVTLRSTGVDLMPTENDLRPGHYDIRPYSRRDTVSVTDELCITRILSRTDPGRDDIFRARVRERDGKCVITGTVNTKAYRDVWTGFEAAHIFPLSSEEYFVQNGLSRWITNRMGPHDTGINSCQNGLLMQSNIHQSFDSFDFSIDPDDGYKIICFDEDPFRIDGRILEPVCRDPNGNRSARDELLRWHFRQAVLANMRGAGEPTFEMDFPPGTDMMGEILSGPRAAERMEAELSLRLNGVYIAQESKS